MWTRCSLPRRLSDVSDIGSSPAVQSRPQQKLFMNKSLPFIGSKNNICL